MAPGFAGTRDTSALMDYARGFAAVRGEIREYPIDHVDVDTEAVYQRLLEDQLDFLGRHLSSTASRRGHNRLESPVNVENQHDANKEAHMKERNVRMIETNGVRLKVIVEGNGPLLLLLHGFPQCAYLWRNQIDDLVAAGYQVAVPDQRGYGGSDKPAEVEAYDLLQLSADAVGIADALGHETFTLVTHDWGAIVGWHVALLYPQRVNAVFALSVPPTIGTPVGALTRQENFGDNFVYTVYFQQPGVAEAELDADVRKSLRMLYYSVSGDAPAFGFMRPKPASSKMLDGLVDPDPLPSWLTEEDLDRYCEDYRDGFQGPINWYRSIDRGIGLTRRLQQTKITQPSHFMIGSLDPMNVLLAVPLANVEQNAPNLRGNVVLEGAGHWLPIERPKEVNAALLDFLAGLESAPQSASITKG